MDAVEADAATADDGDRAAGLDLGRVQRRTEPRRHATADQRKLLEGDVLLDLHHRVLVDQHLLGVGAELRHLGQRRIPSLSLGGSDGPRTTSVREQRAGRPLRHLSQWPQNTDGHMMTRSPGLTYETWSPVASIVPAASWPRIAGVDIVYLPSM